MGFYSAYGVIIQSVVDLPELKTIKNMDKKADILVKEADIPTVPDSAPQHGQIRLQAEPGRYKLTHESIGTFIVESGRTILFDVPSQATKQKKIFRRIILELLLAFALSQRGLLVLHASAVSIDGKAVVFVGDSGVGKSTTAAAFLKQGCSVVDDDLVGIRFNNGSPTVVPGCPQLRLAPESAEALGYNDVQEPSGDAGPEKVYHHFDRDVGEISLERIYILQEGEKLAVKSIPQRNKLFVLITNTYIQEILSDTGLSTNHFQQCSKLVESTPIERLQRPKTLEILPELVDVVINSINHISKTDSSDKNV